MELFPFDKIARLVIFLGTLFLLWLVVQRHKGGLSQQLARGKRMRLAETTALGPTDRAMILRVDQQEFLILKIKGAGISLHPLSGPSATAVPEDAV